MIKAVVSDFSKVLLFRKDDPELGRLNDHHKNLAKRQEYDFWQHFALNLELLEFYKKISTEIDVFVFTTAFIQEDPAVQEKLDQVFKKIFSAAKMGVSKSEKEAYLQLAKALKLQPKEILFVDDSEVNIEAANEIGLKTVRFTSTKSAIDKIKAEI